MDKRGKISYFIILLILLFSLSSFYVAAQPEEQEIVEGVYDWLIQKINETGWQELTTKQLVFSLKALECLPDFIEEGKQELINRSYELNCWGRKEATSERQCKITETALAKLALDQLGENTTQIKRWLLDQSKTKVEGIYWYLQIDVPRGYEADCEIIYGGKVEKGFHVNSDKTVEVPSSECFLPYDNPDEPYWFKIKPSEECYNAVYTIKCWSSAEYYTATLLYKKEPLSKEWFVSTETKTAKPGVPGSKRPENQPETVELRPLSFCLADPNGGCSYEGTGWAAYALKLQGNTLEANYFLPYLVVFSEDNKEYFPYTFLYSLTSNQRYLELIKQMQKPEGYWLVQPIVYGRLYDTAHVGISINDAEALQKAKEWLLTPWQAYPSIGALRKEDTLFYFYANDPGVDLIKDNAFLLYAFFREYCPLEIKKEELPELTECERQGVDYRCVPKEAGCGINEEEVDYACEKNEICCLALALEETCASKGGACREECLENEFELSGELCREGLVCCKAYEEVSCEEIGEICDVDEECNGEVIETSDTFECCLGTCLSKEEVVKSGCIEQGGEICEMDEVCISTLTRKILNFVTTSDSDRCCLGANAKCVLNKKCEDIGKECSVLLGEECSGEIVETIDSEKCCKGSCLRSCSIAGGHLCMENEICPNDNWLTNTMESNCCAVECKKKTSLWWLWLIIILIVIAALGFFLYKKQFKKEKPKLKIKPEFPKPEFPLPRPKEKTKLAAPTQTPIPVPKRKTKTEAELEKTLEKLKKLTKK